MKNLINKVIQGDCLEVMKKIPDNSIDMILCDLPYGTTACSWDTIIPFEPLWEAYKRVIKNNGAIVLTASQPFTSALVMSNPDMFKYEWIWEKHTASNFMQYRFMPAKRHENVLVFCKGKTLYNPIMEEKLPSTLERMKYEFKGRKNSEHYKTDITKDTSNRELKMFPTSIKKFNCERGLHPTQKPVALMEYLIKTYTNEGDLVLDNCLGSGTTAVACQNLHRNFIGIEISEKYCEIARERLRQKPLF